MASTRAQRTRTDDGPVAHTPPGGYGAIVVVATYEDGTHVLRPQGLPVEITRRLDGGELVWRYVGCTARLERVGDVA